MKKFYLSFAVLALFAVWFAVGLGHPAAANGTASPLVSPNLVISQFQAGGTTNFNDEFIEVHNTASTAVDLNGFRVVYRSQDGGNDVTFLAWASTTVLQPGQFYLIAATSYTGSVTPDATFNNTTCQCALAAANGGLAIRQGDANTGAVILPAGWYQVLDTDYSGSGYSRGHIVPSGDRTRSIPDNSATFLMTNMMPQLAANNEGPWNDFENYLRSLANGGDEIYIISGPTGNQGLIAGGKVGAPQYTWKVVLILPNGNNDLERVSKATRAFGIVVPKFSPITTNLWRNYRVTVDAVENITGHNFFSEIPKNTQELIERKRDKL